MLGNGYFIGGTGSSSSSGGKSEDLTIDKEGNLLFAPIDPIHIDDSGNVFFSKNDGNARMYTENKNIYVEKVI